jgi:archaellum component FlaC
MKNILIRAGKDPFTVVDYATCLAKNTLGTNSGNLVFAQATQKHLKTENVTLTTSGYSADPNLADEINEKYDAFVIPLANAFRVSFANHLKKFTKLIEKLKIPTVVVGVGAQSDLDYSFEPMAPLDEDVTAFVKAVLDHSATIGVRGEFTHDYLNRLGFKDVDIIGCPSMFLFGENLKVHKKKARLDESSKISINISPYVERMGDVAMHHYEKYPNLIYIPQNNDSLQQLLWGEPLAKSIESHKIPTRTSHPLFRENKVRFFIDPSTWIDYLKDFDFSFGTRIHGNTVSMLAGTPAVVLAHDSRTLELVEFFEMPFRRIDEIEPTTDAAELYEEASFDKFNAGHADRFRRYLEFLDRNELEHIYADGAAPSSFDEDIKATPFPAALDCLTDEMSRVLLERIGWIHDNQAKETTSLQKKISSVKSGLKADTKKIGEDVSKLKKALSAIEAQAQDLKNENAALKKKTAKLEQKVYDAVEEKLVRPLEKKVANLLNQKVPGLRKRIANIEGTTSHHAREITELKSRGLLRFIFRK